MPIIFSDNHTCEKCGKVFELNYFQLTRQHINSTNITAEPLPVNKTLVHSCQQRDNNVYDIIVNCPHCDFDNQFTCCVK